MMCKKFIIVLALSLLLISSAGAGTVTWDFENGNNHGFNLQSTYPAAAAIDDPNIAGDESITGAGGFSGLPDVGIAWTVGPPNQFDGLIPVVEEGCHIVDGVLEYGPCNDPFKHDANGVNARGQSSYLNTYNLSEWGDDLHIAANDQIASSPTVILQENAVLTAWSLGGGSGTHAPEYDPNPALWYTDGSSGIAVISAEGDYELLATLHLNGKGTLTEDTLDLSALAGRRVFIEVVDAFQGGWGWLAVDEIQITNVTVKYAGIMATNEDNEFFGFDEVQKAHLEGMGYIVQFVRQPDVEAGLYTVDDINELDLFIISESIGSSSADSLIGTTTPIMIQEGYAFDNWSVMGESVNTVWANGAEMEVVNDTHPIAVAAGLSIGPMTFYSAITDFTSDVASNLAPGAESIITTITTDAASDAYAVVFAIDKGAELANGSPALNRIVGFALTGYHQVTAETMTDEAWAVYDAAIAWLNPPPAPMPEPIADYSFDVDGSDATGSFNGTLEGDAAIVDDAERGNVLSLTADGYVSVPPAVTNEMDNFSFTAWVNFAGSNSYPALLGMGNATNGSTPYWDFHLRANGTISFYASEVLVWPGDGSAQVVDSFNLVDNPGWRHIALSFTLGELPLVYVDGEVQTTTDWNSSNDHDVSPKLIEPEVVMIGKDSFNQQTLTNTMIDDFKFYNVALSADDVAAIYDAEKTAE